jgi:hypothetical protein
MEKPEANTQQEKTEIEQFSQAELVELVLGLHKIIEELQQKLWLLPINCLLNSSINRHSLRW